MKHFSSLKTHKKSSQNQNMMKNRKQKLSSMKRGEKSSRRVSKSGENIWLMPKSIKCVAVRGKVRNLTLNFKEIQKKIKPKLKFWKLKNFLK